TCLNWRRRGSSFSTGGTIHLACKNAVSGGWDQSAKDPMQRNLLRRVARAAEACAHAVAPDDNDIAVGAKPDDVTPRRQATRSTNDPWRIDYVVHDATRHARNRRSGSDPGCESR